MQRARPLSSPVLKLEIRELPVAGKDPEPVFPMDVIRASDTEEAMTDDVKQAFRAVDNVNIDRDISLSVKNKFQRGLGQTDIFTILIDAKHTQPQELTRAVEDLIDEGYMFTQVRLE